MRGKTNHRWIHSRRTTERSLLILALSSLISLAIYVRSLYLFRVQILPEVFFWIFAVTFSLAIMALWAFCENQKTVLWAIFASAVVIVSIPFLRFYFYGADLVGEYFVADATYELGRWTPESASAGSIWLDWHFLQKPDKLVHKYFSTISVTILPAIVSEVTGISTRLVLWILLCTVSTTAVMTVFLISKSCFGYRIAALSSIVFIFSTYYMGKYATILREDIALLFLLLAIFSILKGGKRGTVLCLVSLMMLPMCHYGLVYFAILLVLLLFVSKKVHRNRILTKLLISVKLGSSNHFSEQTAISGNLVLYSIVVGLFWLIFVAYPIFVHDLGGFVESFKGLLGLAPIRPSYFQQHILFSSLGTFHTAVQWLERVMAALGLVLTLKTCNSQRKFSFAFGGTGILATGLALALLPDLSLLFDLDRAAKVGLLWYSVFIAIAVFSVFRRNRLGKVFSVLFIVLILLETIHLPILYSPAINLGREEYVFSFSNVFSFYEFSDFQFAKWTQSSTRKSVVFASDERGYSLCLIAKRICVQPRGANLSDTISLLKSGKTDYFLVLYYLPDYMSFRSERRDEMRLDLTDISKLLDSDPLNRIYSNSRVILLCYV